MKDLFDLGLRNSANLREFLEFLADNRAYDEETGDTEWGEWACLFRFTPEEVASILYEFPGASKWLEDCRGTVSLFLDRLGFRDYGNEADFALLKRDYAA